MCRNVKHPVAEESKLKGVPKFQRFIGQQINVYDLAGEPTQITYLEHCEHHQMEPFAFKFPDSFVKVEVDVDGRNHNEKCELDVRSTSFEFLIRGHGLI